MTMDDLSAANLQPYLAERFGKPRLIVIDVTKFTRGISRETWSIDYIDPDVDPAETICLILRRDLAAFGLVPTSLRYEYEVYRRLTESGLPVAKTLFYEEDVAVAPGGRDFYLRERVEGSWEIPNYLSSDPRFSAMRVEIAKEHLRKLAMIHAVDWRAYDFQSIMVVPDDEADCGPCAVDRNLEALAEWQIEPMPILTEAREWLYDNAPVATRVALLKGTNGIGEEVFRDGVIVALSDWEQASLGDPASDLARTQDVLMEVRDAAGQRIWGLEEGLAYYQEVSGTPVTKEAVSYYHTLVSLENSVSLHHGTTALCAGTELSARVAWISTEIVHYGNLQLLGAVEERPSDTIGLFLSTAGTE